MYLCVCNAITEDSFKKVALKDGIIQAVIRTGAGNCCGSCIDRIEEIEEELSEIKILSHHKLNFEVLDKKLK